MLEGVEMGRAILGAVLATLIWVGKPEPLERVGRLAAPAIREASGMTASRTHPGIYWVHNDSGNAAELFAVRRDGQLVRSYKVAAPNIDWEDIAADDSGHLYLADTGNNRLNLPLRAVHTLVEPDPTAPQPPERLLSVLASNYYQFPGGRRFDAEGMIVAGGQILLITKRRDGQAAELYRLPLAPASSLLRPATPERVGLLPGCVEPVTGASLAPDGQQLAVVTDSSVRVYRSTNMADWTLLGSAAFRAPDVEAITWDGADLILASEDRSVYRLPPERWRAAPRAER